MKKILLIVILLLPYVTFAQSNLESLSPLQKVDVWVELAKSDGNNDFSLENKFKSYIKKKLRDEYNCVITEQNERNLIYIVGMLDENTEEFFISVIFGIISSRPYHAIIFWSQYLFRNSYDNYVKVCDDIIANYDQEVIEVERQLIQEHEQKK